MSIIGIGIDIIKISRIKKIINKFGNKFIKKILSKNEFINFLNHNNKIFFIAKKYSIKESISKALGTGFQNNIFFNSFEISHNNFGKPKIKFLGFAKKIAILLQIKSIYISITDEKKYVLSLVILEK